MIFDNGDRVKAVLAAAGHNFYLTINRLTMLLSLLINVKLGLTFFTGTKPSRSRLTD